MASKYRVENHYGSVAEITELPLPTREKNKSIWSGCSTSTSRDWWGPNQESVGDVLSFSKNGWEWGAEQISSMSEQISIPILANVKRRLSKGPDGDYLDIHQVYRGNISTAWTKKRRKAGTGPKRFQLLCRLGANCGTSGEKLFWRGVATAALAKAMVEAGHAVEIIGHSIVRDCFKNSGGSDIGQEIVTIKIKEYGMPLDLESLAVTACLSGFYRYYLFLNRLIHEGLDCDYGLGRHEYTTPKIESGDAKQVEVPEDIKSKIDVERFLSEITNKL